MQDPKRRPWYHRVKEMATIWRTVSTKPPPIPVPATATNTTTLWRTFIATATDNPPHHRHRQDQSNLRTCTSLRVASSFTRACLCVPLSSYDEVFRSEINHRPTPPRRSNSYPRSRPINSSSSSSSPAGGSVQPRRSAEVTATATATTMMVAAVRRREVFWGKSPRAEEKRRNQMEAVRRRGITRRKEVGPSRLRRMVLAGDSQS